MKCTDIPEKIQQLIEKDGGFEGIIARLPDEEVIRRQSRIYHALADPIRLTIIQLLVGHPFCVCVIKEVIDIADSKLSYHLSVLQKNGLIEGKRNKNFMIYELTKLGQEYAMKKINDEITGKNND